MRNALSYVGRAQQSMVSAALRQAFIQPDRAGASQMLRHTADQLHGMWPKLAAFIDDSDPPAAEHLGSARLRHVAPARILGRRTKLQAAAVSDTTQLTRGRPRCRVLRKPAACLIQPNGSYLLHQLSLGAHAVEGLQQQGAEQLLGCDRGAAGVGRSS